MIDLREAIRARLATDPALAELVGARIRPSLIAQGDPLPAACVQIVSNPRDHWLLSNNGIASARVQIDAIAYSVAECVAIKRAVEDRLDGWRGEALGIEIPWIGQEAESDQHEPPGDGSDRWIYRVVSEYRIKYRVPVITR